MNTGRVSGSSRRTRNGWAPWAGNRPDLGRTTSAARSPLCATRMNSYANASPKLSANNELKPTKPELQDERQRPIDMRRRHVTNAATEGTNHLIKDAARCAFGFRNLANQRRRVRWACTRRQRQWATK